MGANVVPPEDVHLVSPWAPSGVAWLLNALLELGVPIFRDAAIVTWHHDPASDTCTLDPREEDLKRHVPSLTRLERFRFRTRLRVRWSHEWPTGENQRTPIILCVRDGADALLSLHRRFHDEITPGRFLREPSPVMFSLGRFAPALTPLQQWALFTQVWADSTRTPLLIVRFEDLKASPVTALRPIADFLRLSPTDDELAQAAEYSSFERAKAAEDKIIAARPELNRFRANRSGRSGESAAAFGAEDWRLFRGTPDLALTRFGYRPRSAEASPPPGPGIAQVRAWAQGRPAADPLSFGSVPGLDVRTTRLARACARWADDLAPRGTREERRAIWLALVEHAARLTPSETLEDAIHAAERSGRWRRRLSRVGLGRLARRIRRR